MVFFRKDFKLHRKEQNLFNALLCRGKYPFFEGWLFPLHPRENSHVEKTIRNESKRIVASSNLLETNCFFTMEDSPGGIPTNMSTWLQPVKAMIFVHLILFCTPELYIYSPSLTWFTLKKWWVFPSSKKISQFRQMAGFFPPMRSLPSEVIMEHIQVIFNTKARTFFSNTLLRWTVMGRILGFRSKPPTTFGVWKLRVKDLSTPFVNILSKTTTLRCFFGQLEMLGTVFSLELRGWTFFSLELGFVGEFKPEVTGNLSDLGTESPLIFQSSNS